MINSTIQILLLKYYNKIATEAERQDLFRWLAQEENRVQAMELLQDLYAREGDEPHNLIVQFDAAEILTSILLTPRLTVSRNKWRWIVACGVAASLLICLGIYLLYSKRIPDFNALEDHLALNDIPPGGKKAILTTSAGHRYLLDSTTYRATASAGGELIFNTIETPTGGFYQIQLPDGTAVWLNAESSLQFPSAFTENERKVQLIGEAYFEVVHDKYKPFVVDVCATQVKVLGTHFNIDSYAEASEIYTTVLEGAVSVQNNKHQALVKAGEQLQELADETMVLNRDFNPAQVLAWKEGYFSEKSIRLQELMDEVERWYGVNVEYVEPIQAEFVVKLPKNISLRELINLLEMTEVVKFDLTAKTLKVMKINS